MQGVNNGIEHSIDSLCNIYQLDIISHNWHHNSFTVDLCVLLSSNSLKVADDT